MTTDPSDSLPPTASRPPSPDSTQVTQLIQIQSRIDQRLARIEADMADILAYQRTGSQQVMVQDVSMNFGSMVFFMVKWAIASIPAAIILFVITGIAFLVFGGFMAALFR